MVPILVTGAAGFIGAAVSERLLARGERVIGLDNLNAYYDPALKQMRLERLEAQPGFTFTAADIADSAGLLDLVRREGVKRIVHLAAQAGVRHSLDHPFDYERSNLAGHLAVIEAARRCEASHLVYASSSSVYGERPADGLAFREDEAAVRPVSLYAATKRSAELMSEAYASLYGFPQTGLRFFTVYGPRGRPDMAYFRFTRQILAGEPIEVYGEGKMARDFTHIDDIVEGVVGALDHVPATGEHRILNVGAGQPFGLMQMIGILEGALGREATKIMRPMQPGDVTHTYADVSRLAALTGYKPKVTLEAGLTDFAAWYRQSYC